MTIEITKGSENPVAEFFSNPSDTPETDEMKCLSLIEVMELPRERRRIALGVLQAIKERDEARKDAAQLADSICGLELRTTEELARLERERDEARFLLKQAQSVLDTIHLEIGGWIKTMKEHTD
jgi:hypothetical protein